MDTTNEPPATDDRRPSLCAVRTKASGLVGLGPADNDHVHACRVVIGLVVPGVVLLIAERPDLIIFAVFGSFTGMYGRAESHRLRLRHQAQAGTVLLTGVGTGVVLSSVHARSWMLVATEVVFASIGSLVTDRLGLSPQGPFYGIFAVGAVATIPADRVAAWPALSICAATATFCILVSTVGMLAAPGPGGRQLHDVRPTACAAKRRAADSRVHALRYALAISAAGSSGLLLGIDHANWAMAAAAVPLAAANARDGHSLSVSGVIQRGMHRVLGTLAGLVVAALLLLPHLGATFLAAVVIALLFPTELFMTRHYGLAVWFFTPLIMLMTQLAAPAEPLTFLADRAIDNLIGVAAGIAVAVLIRGGRSTTPTHDRLAVGSPKGTPR
ncbi:FUSC family protein [Mycobacterium talmoniae]|uniref:FUSC family protein n=1 Tax=Mycobacterium talmoniae TaxID=1858794 RepID=UPI001F624BD2|nr:MULTISPECIES: FUSC family protein [Mycobacterium]